MEKHKAGLSQIKLHFLKPATISNRNRLKSFLLTQFLRNKIPLQSLQIILCSDTYLLDLNRRFLHHDTYTDVITFNLAEAHQPVVGEIYISVDRVRDNAKNLSVGLTEELHRVIFHGILHLMGHQDKTNKEKKQIRALESNLLIEYSGYVSRGT